jgi:hypothetical protein
MNLSCRRAWGSVQYATLSFPRMRESIRVMDPRVHGDDKGARVHGDDTVEVFTGMTSQ